MTGSARPAPVVAGVTRALCWLPPQSADRQRDTISEGAWSLVRDTRRLLGRIGYLVITETCPELPLVPVRDPGGTP